MSERNPSRSPIRVMFLLTSMPIGGAETLLVNLIHTIDRKRIEPIVGCMKQKDVLGEVLAKEIPVFEGLINHKYDFAVAKRLKKIFVDNQIDTLITIGAGDKMFWGRIAARRARVPVVLSALHSTGWPDGIGRLNRVLTRITDGFIAVARRHAQYQIEQEKFPAEKVFLIPNGIDTERFQFDEQKRTEWRRRLDLEPDAPVVGIVAALRPEKNHELFLNAAGAVAESIPGARFVIAGDGPERAQLEIVAEKLGLSDRVRFLGSTQDVPGILSMIDVFALSSRNEASPVSILEAMSCQRPVVATDVGSIDESVLEGKTGFLVPSNDSAQMASRWMEILKDPMLQKRMGSLGRGHVVEHSSISVMTEGYTSLVEDLYERKTRGRSLFPGGYVTWECEMPVENPANWT